MEHGRAVLLIADIGGYTEYMRSHRMSLAHAEVNTARLLEKVIDAAHDFDLIEIEGDAAFLSRQADTLDRDDAVSATTQTAVGMHRAFHLERQHVATNLCPCDGCVQADNLKLKFVAHIGEVAIQTIKQRRKLVGIDVILVHRLLKNPIHAPEYVLFSEDLYRTSEAALPNPVHEISHDLEGIGPVRAYFVEIEDPAGSVPPLPDPPLLRRLGRTVDVVGRGLPYMLGLRRRRQTASAL
jgi:class 3 adenylate cyclase